MHIQNFDDNKADELVKNFPLPVLPDKQDADLLEVDLQEQDPKSPSNIKYKILLEIWKLSKTRSILINNEIFEKEWLEELKEKYFSAIDKNLKLLPISTVNKKFITWVRNECDSKKIWSDHNIIAEIVSVLQQEANHNI